MNKIDFEKKVSGLLEGVHPSHFERVCDLLENVGRLNKIELDCVLKISKDVGGAREFDINYLPKHFLALKKGETIRVSPTQYSWVKDAMINMQYAAQGTTRYMNNFMRVEKGVRDKLPEIMNLYEAINTSAKRISKLCRPKAKKPGSQKKYPDEKVNSPAAATKEQTETAAVQQPTKPTAANKETDESQETAPVPSKVAKTVAKSKSSTPKTAAKKSTASKATKSATGTKTVGKKSETAEESKE